jgi:hypothetical protein
MVKLTDYLRDIIDKQAALKAAAPATAPASTAPVTPPPEVIDPAKMTMARQAAIQRAELGLRSQGLDPKLYMDAINAEFDKVAGTAALHKDPYSIFSDDIATNVVKAQNETKKQEFMKDFEGRFGMAADQAALPSTMLDDTINKILAEQQGTAQQQLDRGKARGIYNDVGYNAGQQAINTAAGTARSELNNLGGSFIDTYRGGLNDIDASALGAYQSFPVGDSSFSLDPYVQERSDYLGRAQSGAEGQLRSAIGGKNFFDFGKIGGQAGTAQGALNLKDTDVATALGERKRLNTMSRGLGSQGAF